MRDLTNISRTDIFKHADSVFGKILSMQPNGAGIVRLDDGRHAYFDRFAVLATEIRKYGRLKEGDFISAKISETHDDIVKLVDVAPVGNDVTYSPSDKSRLDEKDIENDIIGNMSMADIREKLFGERSKFNVKAALPKVFKSTVSKTPERESMFPEFKVNVRDPDFSKRRELDYSEDVRHDLVEGNRKAEESGKTFGLKAREDLPDLD